MSGSQRGAPSRRRFAKASMRLVPIDARQRIGSMVADDVRLENLIGAGPHGTVYAATTLDHRNVAVKVFSPEVVKQPRPTLPRSIGHPSLVEIETVGLLDDGSVFATMPLVTGVDVATLLAEAPFPPRQALRLVRQALLGLRAAHDAGIVHADLKPENLMVSGVGIVDDDLHDVDEPLRVLDVGLARVLGAVAGSCAHGSRSVAPEVTQTGRVTMYSDLFAMGIVLVEMLAGEPTSATLGVDPSWSEELAFVIWKALQPDPRDRYRDATGMIAGIDAAMRSLDRPG